MEKSRNHSQLSIVLRATDRAGVRAEVFQYWIAEVPGTSSFRNTYRYDVEKLSDGSLIYLTRPARLNKGADFVIVCESFLKFKNGNARPPKFEDVIQEIQKLISVSEAHRNELLVALRCIWECRNSKQVIEELSLFKGNVSAERALLLAKWFFIEQDVTYWTESGRHMLRAYIEKYFGGLP